MFFTHMRCDSKGPMTVLNVMDPTDKSISQKCASLPICTTECPCKNSVSGFQAFEKRKAAFFDLTSKPNYLAHYERICVHPKKVSVENYIHQININVLRVALLNPTGRKQEFLSKGDVETLIHGLTRTLKRFSKTIARLCESGQIT